VSWSLRLPSRSCWPMAPSWRCCATLAYLGKALPKSDHDMPAVLTAAEMLMNAAEQRGPVEVCAELGLKVRTPPRPASDRVVFPKVKI
jgi:hypothetical protein